MLKTNRLTLRAAVQSDLNDLFAIYSDPRAMKYWSTAPHVSPARTQKNLDWMIKSAHGQLVFFVIETGGHVIGTAGMHGDNEVGFILHPDYWRKGIVTEAMKAVIPYLFDTIDVDHLTADADPLNVASIDCLKNLGFHVSGTAKNTFCINDVWSDSVYFTLQRPINLNAARN
jgi:ribosomal-protein-alanine N-acetyltransferase